MVMNNNQWYLLHDIFCCLNFNHSDMFSFRQMPWNERENLIVDWMTKSESKANLVMAYFKKTVSCHSKKELKSCQEGYIKKVDETIK